tara:strand:- start:29 stop:607 length:579 start_codon:yes stop_codon:yes gene_type:complete
MVKDNLFVHIPRTGGTSIHACLGEYATARTDHILGTTAKKKWPEYFRYTFMRNPYTRMVSLYEYQFIDPPDLHSATGKSLFPLTFEKYVNIITNKYDGSYERWIFVQATLQTDWVFDDDNCLTVDYIGRTEFISADANAIAKMIGVENFINIKHLNQSSWRNENYKDYYNDDIRKKVKKHYQKDIEFLKVKF